MYDFLKDCHDGFFTCLLKDFSNMDFLMKLLKHYFPMGFLSKYAIRYWNDDFFQGVLKELLLNELLSLVLVTNVRANYLVTACNIA